MCLCIILYTAHCYFSFRSVIVLSLAVLSVSCNCAFLGAFVFLFYFLPEVYRLLFRFSGVWLCLPRMFALCSSFPAAFTSLHFKFYTGMLGGNFPLFCGDFVKFGSFLIFSFPLAVSLYEYCRNFSNSLCLNELQFPEPAFGRKILRGGEFGEWVSLGNQIHCSAWGPL